MPYRKINRGYKKRPIRKGKKMMKKPLSIRQVRAINTLVNKGRELKRFYTNVIDLNCAPNQNVDMEFQPKLASGQPARLGASHVIKGDRNESSWCSVTTTLVYYSGVVKRLLYHTEHLMVK